MTTKKKKKKEQVRLAHLDSAAMFTQLVSMYVMGKSFWPCIASMEWAKYCWQNLNRNSIKGNCSLPIYDFVRFNSIYLWFKSYHLTHLRWPPLDTCYPSLPFSLKNPLYYISHNRNIIRSNILKNNFSLTILEIKSSNPNPISWPESCSINTIIGSLFFFFFLKLKLAIH